MKTTNKGCKEFQDVIDCIHHYKIPDDDFVVKLTGRYIIEYPNEFMDAVKKNIYDCVIKYGSYYNPVTYKTKDCITGLIGMRGKYIKKIVCPKENECIEWKWAEITYDIEDDKIYKVIKLNTKICPGGNEYFNV
jgi:hypothetical protein